MSKPALSPLDLLLAAVEEAQDCLEVTQTSHWTLLTLRFSMSCHEESRTRIGPNGANLIDV
jgi:hypothetical protein